MNRKHNRNQQKSVHSVSGRGRAEKRSHPVWAEALESRVLLSSAINAGGDTVGSFAADNSFAGGHPLSTTADLPAGSTITYTATGAVDTLFSPIPAALSDTAMVSGGSVPDPNSANNSASDMDTITASVPQADQSVTITGNKTGIAPGSADTYATYSAALTSPGELLGDAG
jgi:hypothetical protein